MASLCGLGVLLSFLDLAANNGQGCVVVFLRQLSQVLTVLDQLSDGQEGFGLWYFSQLKLNS